MLCQNVTAKFALIADQGYESISRARLIEALQETGALQMAKERAIEYAEAARNSLNGLNDRPHAQALAAIPTYIVERDR